MFGGLGIIDFPKCPKQSCHTHSLSLVCPLLHTDYSKSTFLLSLNFKPTQPNSEVILWTIGNLTMFVFFRQSWTQLIAYLHQLLIVVCRLQNSKFTPINFNLPIAGKSRFELWWNFGRPTSRSWLVIFFFFKCIQ